MSDRVSFENFPQSARASTTAIELEARPQTTPGEGLPPRILIIGQHDNRTTQFDYHVPTQMFTLEEVGVRTGFGSQIYRQAKWVFFHLGGFSDLVWVVSVPAGGGGTRGQADIVFSLPPVGTLTTPGILHFLIGGERVEVSVPGNLVDTTAPIANFVAAVNGNVELPITAVDISGPANPDTLRLLTKWDDVTANDIQIILNPDGEVQARENPGNLTITMPERISQGAGGPYLRPVFFDNAGMDKLGDRWFTIVVCPHTAPTQIATLIEAGNARNDPSTHKMFAAYLGYREPDSGIALSIPSAINSEWINPVNEPRSLSPAFELGASVAGAVAASNRQDPGRPCKTLPLGIPVDRTQPNMIYAQADAYFRAGLGYCKIDAAGLLRIGDLATSYRTTPGGTRTEAWLDSVSIHRRQQKVFDIDNLVNGPPYDRAMLGSDNIVTGKSYVIKPKTIITNFIILVDFWASQGWTKNPDQVKQALIAHINEVFDGRLDSEITDDEAHALRIVAVKYAFI